MATYSDSVCSDEVSRKEVPIDVCTEAADGSSLSYSYRCSSGDSSLPISFNSIVRR